MVPAGNLLTLLVNGLELCDPLGDKTVWGSIFKLDSTRINNGAIMLATKVKREAHISRYHVFLRATYTARDVRS